ncbi:predicted protein [Lichtheimia corymbifera JMRC:FSU:9682]|uniref:Uncharacterized protein n=1 Tax=Lichtheimia corymbifera JMRC:FSU:9682 TaxID=1263082 RepID=A0A068RYX4_9FUNG|nr:predicted protein [Lichtheimia corymbifera JMRC:FSU:9682]
MSLLHCLEQRSQPCRVLLQHSLLHRPLPRPTSQQLLFANPSLDHLKQHPLLSVLFALKPFSREQQIAIVLRQFAFNTYRLLWTMPYQVRLNTSNLHLVELRWKVTKKKVDQQPDGKGSAAVLNLQWL